MKQDIEKTRRITKRLVAIMGIGSMLIGIVSGAYATYELAEGIISNHWPSVEGEIIESRLVIRHFRSGHASSHSRNEYHPLVRYKYYVNNLPYTNNKIMFGAIGGTDINLSRHYVNQLPVGKKVRVYYSPFNHENSVLIKGKRNKTVAGVIASIVFFAVGLLFYRLRDFYANSVPDN